MRHLLLISTSRTHGTGYLEHCASDLQERFQGAVTPDAPVIFVPYAFKDYDSYIAIARPAFESMGFTCRGIHEGDPRQNLREAGAVFIGGGNTFRLLDTLYREQLVEPLRERVKSGMPYAGASAGSNVATLNIRTTNDMPILQPPTFDALGFIPFNLNPHYLDPDPTSKHMGETRETRIREFHEENEQPVLGLREGSMLWVDDDTAQIRGEVGARLFVRGEEARELEPGADVSFLLV